MTSKEGVVVTQVASIQAERPDADHTVRAPLESPEVLSEAIEPCDDPAQIDRAMSELDRIRRV